MAKLTKKISFANATIHFSDGTIEEVPKKKDDSSKFYNLKDIIKDWDEITGVNFSISTDDDIPEMEE